MAKNALFAGLVYDEAGKQVGTAIIGEDAHYVVDDDGFHRHIESEVVDRQVLAIFLAQLEDNRDLAIEQTLKLMGKDDLFTKAAIDASLRHINMDQIIAQGIPEQARDMMGLLGFQVVINVHGDLLRLEQPAAPEDE